MASVGKDRPDPKDFQFCKLERKTLIKLPGSINGLDFILEDLTDCKVFLLDHSSQVQIDNCKGCEILIGPVDGPAFFRDCHNCRVAVACRQLRTRDCQNVDISLHVATDPIIESSSNMRFCPWTPGYPEAKSQFKAANLLPGQNKWQAVYDFTPPAPGEAQHWSVLAEAERPEWSIPANGKPSEAVEGGVAVPMLEDASTESLEGISSEELSAPRGTVASFVASQKAVAASPGLGLVSEAGQARAQSETVGKSNPEARVLVSGIIVPSGSESVSVAEHNDRGAGRGSTPEEPAMVESMSGDTGSKAPSTSEKLVGSEDRESAADEGLAEAGDQTRREAPEAKPGILDNLFRSVRRLFSRMTSPWRKKTTRELMAVV